MGASSLWISMSVLYLAKKGGNWLKTDDPDVAMLENGEVPEGINDVMKKRGNKMDPRYRIGNSAFNFPDEDDAGEDEIHVLVAVPGRSWSTQLGSANKEPHPTRKRRWEGLNELLDGNKKAKIKDGESSTGYSYVSFKGVNKVMPADQYAQSTKAIEDGKIDVLYAYLLVVTKAFVEVVTGTEAKRTHFIAPVLACVCALFNGDVQILAEDLKKQHHDILPPAAGWRCHPAVSPSSCIDFMARSRRLTALLHIMEESSSDEAKSTTCYTLWGSCHPQRLGAQ